MALGKLITKPLTVKNWIHFPEISRSHSGKLKYDDKNQTNLKCTLFKVFLATSLAAKPDEKGDKNISVVTTDVEPVEEKKTDLWEKYLQKVRRIKL